MLANILFLVILLCGALVGITVTRHRFEEILPISAMGIVLILFLTGILGIPLSAGAVLVIVSYLVLGVGGLFWHIRREGKGTVSLLKEKMLTPAFVVFLVIFFSLSFFDRGKLATGWDEFTHWIDCVKTMVIVDDFVTNPESGSAFNNYPPSMALFQFFLQRIYLWIHPGQLFSEWHNYFAYQVFAVSIWMPFMRKLRFRRPFEMITIPVAVVLVPLFFYRDFYMSLYVDAFLGILAGCGMAYLFIKKEKDWTDLIYIGMLLFTLTLAKDSGRVFSLFVVLAFILEQWVQNRKLIFTKEAGWRERMSKILLPLLMLVPAYLPHLLWKNELRISGIPGASVPVRLGTFFGVLFFGKSDTDYGRDQVVYSFAEQFRENRLSIGQLPISFLGVSIILFLLIFLAVLCYQKKVKADAGRYILITVLTIFMAATYVIGTGALYISRFSDYEAYNLASFNRYMGTAYLSATVFLLLVMIEMIICMDVYTSAGFTTLLVLFSVCTGPVDQMEYYLSRQSIAVSAAWRASYDVIAEKIRDLPVEASIYMVSQESNGEEFVVLRYVLRPWKLSGTASLGGPFYDGDVWSIQVEPEAWMDQLVDSYDYVALKNLNANFYETYGYLFEDENAIKADSIYRIDKENRKLIFLE